VRRSFRAQLRATECKQARTPSVMAAILAMVETIMTWLHALRDASVLGVGAALLGVIGLAARLDVPWVPAPKGPETTACGDDTLLAVADVSLPRAPLPEVRKQIEHRGDAIVLVDARAGHAFAEAHIPGAISLPADEIDALLASQSLPIPTQGEIVMYCDRADSADAEYVGRVLGTALGCQTVRVLDGGWNAWLDADGPVEGAMQSG
jgi:rhodanese-related sulfurtransferase